MPDKWEFPWFATWDLAFHTVPYANLVDPHFRQGGRRCLMMAGDGTCIRTGSFPLTSTISGTSIPLSWPSALARLGSSRWQKTPKLAAEKKDFHFLRRV